MGFKRIVARRPRLTGFTLLAGLLLGIIGYLAPAQLPVILHKMALETLAGVLGYWLHRHAFPQEVHKLIEATQRDERMVPLAAAACVSRAIVMGAAMIAVGVAL